MNTRNPLIGLVDEVTRLHGRLKTAFSPARRSVGLGQSEMTVLNAVVEAERPPTVPQIGRSMGSPRQLIQRSANVLMEAGLVEAAPNPDHKRAALLIPTQKGIELKRQADAKADEIAAVLAELIDMNDALAATRSLAAVRRVLEDKYREDSR
ncbi:MAG: transcriptional regulator [Novosphingobium sp.]|nr:transcriptional regulator [Novosphingobium sp.]